MCCRLAVYLALCFSPCISMSANILSTKKNQIDPVASIPVKMTKCISNVQTVIFFAVEDVDMEHSGLECPSSRCARKPNEHDLYLRCST